MNEQTPTQDRRVRKTKKALRESLIALMAEKNIREISVQELSDHADLNRATFYLHYRDIFELLQQLEDEVTQELEMILDQHMDAPDEKNPYPLFVALLIYIQENAHLCEMLLSENSGRSFLDKLCALVEERCLHTWLSQQQGSEERLAYFSSFVVYGYVAAIAKWVRTGMAASPEHMAKLLGDMGLYGIGCLEENH